VLKTTVCRLQPDNESIAYTFRELVPEGGKGDAKGDDKCNADGDCAGGSTEAAEQQAAAGHSNVRSDTGAGGSNGRGSGELAIDATPAAGEGAAGGSADSQPAAAASASAAAAQPAGAQQQQEQQQQPGEAVAALQEAGLLRRHSSRRRSESCL
jgi:hypothetical protein